MPPGPPVKFRVAPTQIGELLEAEATGRRLMTTVVLVGTDVQPEELVTTRVYTPALAVVTLEMDGLCKEEVKLFGPVQEYVVIPEGPPVKFRVAPTQTGELLDAVATGRVLITTVVVVGADEQPEELVTTRVYTPAAAVVTLLIDGFCNTELNPFGPIQA